MNIPKSVKNLLPEVGCKNCRDINMKYEGFSVFEPIPEDFHEWDVPRYVLLSANGEAHFASKEDCTKIYKRFYLD